MFKGRLSSDTCKNAEAALDYLRRAAERGGVGPDEIETLESLIQATVTSAALTDGAVLRSQRMLRRGVELRAA